MKNRITILTMIVLGVSNLACTAQKEIIYMGSYSQRDSKGIYIYEFDRAALAFNLVQTVSDFINPSFLVLNPDGNFLYSVVTVKGEGDTKFDAVASFSINENDGRLTPLNKVPTHGKGACHVSIDKTGKWIFVSHYGSGSLAVFPVNNDGSIGDTIQFIQNEGGSVHPRQTVPHVHSSLVSPDNKYLYVADLGTDKVLIYSLDQKTGRLTATTEAFSASRPGSGPRHFTFHPDNSCFYVADEISSSVSVYTRDAKTGFLSSLQTISTLPEGFSGQNTVADIHCSPNGKYVYVSNRGHNSLAIFSIMEDGSLVFVAHEPVQGDHPRNFVIDPKGDYLIVANQNTDNVVIFKMDHATGLLKYSGTTLNIPAVSCLIWK